jgi:hypothetical protein
MSYATLLGYTILKDGTGTTAYRTPPIARQSREATFSIEATHVAGTVTLVATVEHKNLDESTWASAGTFDDVTAVGVKTKTLSDLKEEIRFAFTYSAGTAGEFVHVVIPEPTWKPE